MPWEGTLAQVVGAEGTLALVVGAEGTLALVVGLRGHLPWERTLAQVALVVGLRGGVMVMDCVPLQGVCGSTTGHFL